MLKPVLTEKSLKLAEDGIYTFYVGRGLNKGQIRHEIDNTFGVHVVKIRTLKVGGSTKKNVKGYKKIVKPRKKAMVKLAEKEKIDLFEVKGKKKK